MKGFSIKTEIVEFNTFEEFAHSSDVGADDLFFCSRHTYNQFIAPLKLRIQILFRDDYEAGEPTDVIVNDMLEDMRSRTFNRIVAVGGGTVIDIAKALAVAKDDDTVDHLFDKLPDLKKRHPLIIIPTTCGTGSEVTNISVINRITKGVKMGLVSDAMLPDKAALITEMLDTLPYNTFATSSIDAMVHSVESFLSPNGCSISRVFSEEALRTILKCWKNTINDGGGEAWKKYAADYLKASNWAGLGFGYAGCAAVHACAYPLGSVHHIPHGKSNQLVFEAVMRKYKEIAPEGRIQELEMIIADSLHTDEKDALSSLYELMDNILKREPLHMLGVKENELLIFANNVIETQQRLLKNNYVELTESQLVDIYKFSY